MEVILRRERNIEILANFEQINKIKSIFNCENLLIKLICSFG